MRFLFIILSITLFFSQVKTEVFFEVNQIYLTGEDKEIIKYENIGNNKNIIEKYLLDITGRVVEYQNFSNPNSYYVNNPQLLNSNNLKTFLNGLWKLAITDSNSINTEVPSTGITNIWANPNQNYMLIKDNTFFSIANLLNGEMNDVEIISVDTLEINFFDLGSAKISLYDHSLFDCDITPLNNNLLNFNCRNYVSGQYERVPLIESVNFENKVKENLEIKNKIIKKIDSSAGEWHTENKAHFLNIKTGRRRNISIRSTLFDEWLSCDFSHNINSLNDTLIFVSNKFQSTAPNNFQSDSSKVVLKYINNNIIINFNNKDYFFYKSEESQFSDNVIYKIFNLKQFLMNRKWEGINEDNNITKLFLFSDISFKSYSDYGKLEINLRSTRKRKNFRINIYSKTIDIINYYKDETIDRTNYYKDEKYSAVDYNAKININIIDECSFSTNIDSELYIFKEKNCKL